MVKRRDSRSQEAEAYRPWYRTARWRALRDAVLLRDLYTCQDCGALVGLRKYDAVADHIKPHKGDERLFWNADNLQTLCAPCHNRHKQREEKTGKARTRFTDDGRVIW